MQEWLCDNRLEVTTNISIALRNHERSYAEWFKHVDDNTAPDELAVYCLSRKIGVHTCVFNKSFIWTTLANYLTQTDEEIMELCGVILVFLGPNTYGILRKIRRPNPSNKSSTTPAPVVSKIKNKKVTCRSSGAASRAGRSKSRGSKTTNKKRSETLSESRERTYGITPTVKTTRSRSGSLRPIDYLSLNDGLDDCVEPPSPKKRKRTTHRPKSGPSASRIAAQEQITSPHPKTKPNVSSLSAVPPPTPSETTAMDHSSLLNSKVTEFTNTSAFSAVPSGTEQNQSLTGIPPYSQAVQDILPDLVVNTQNLDSTVMTEEELAAADTLLTLIEPRDDTQDEDDDDNALLMPIVGPSNIVDAAPVPLELNHLDVDRAIANIVETEEVQKIADIDNMVPTTVEQQTSESTKPAQADDTSEDTIPYTVEDNQTMEPDNDNSKIGSSPKRVFDIKTHGLKKKCDNKRTYKCTVCGSEKTSVQKVNEHHLRRHKPLVCTICGRMFSLAMSLARHMYDHEERRHQCETCSSSFHFESELKAHNILHRKNPAFQCMYRNCGKWFRRKWELTVHVSKHDGRQFKCDSCDFTTNLEKQLKEHQIKHSDDCRFVCKLCDKGFHYRSGLKRHRDKVHKEQNKKTK